LREPWIRTTQKAAAEWVGAAGYGGPKPKNSIWHA